MPLDEHALIEHDARLRRLARAIVKDQATADDLVQRAYLAALARRNSIRSPLHWLIGAIRRLALETFRSDSRRRNHERKVSGPQIDASPAELIEREQLRRAVFDGWMALEEPLRTTLRLRFLEGLPPREIARLECVSVEIVHARVARGIAVLRTRLASLDPADPRRPFVVLAPFAAGAPLEGLGAIVSSVISGALVMSTKAKLAALIGAVAMTSFLVFEASSPDPRSHRESAEAPVADPRVEDPEGEPITVDAPTIDRETIALTEVDGKVVAPSSAHATTGSLLVKAIFDPDLAPAAHLGIRVTVFGGSRLQPEVRKIVTDAHGEARIDDIVPGHVSIQSDRGGMDGLEILEGDRATFEFHVPPGALIEGRVLDSSGHPVAAAGIFLSEQVSGEGSIVAYSDSFGRYSLRNVSSLHYLGARKDGYAPSRLRLLLGSPDARHEIDLLLPEPGGALEGTVVSASGAPIEGAAVVFDPENLAAGDTGYGRDDLAAVPHSTTTDAVGRYRFGGLPQGSFAVKAHADGYSIATESVEIIRGGVTRATLRLAKSGRVRGRVIDGSGAPIASAILRNASDELLGEYTVASDREGRFELTDVPAGTVSLLVTSESHLERVVETIVMPGEETRVDIVLERGRAILGRVVDESGVAMKGVSIDATARDPTSGEGRFSRAMSDDDGRFVLPGLAETSWTLDFMVPPSFMFPSLRANGVAPEPSERLFRIPRATLPSASMRGRVLDPAGKPLVGARVTIARSGRGTAPLITTDSEGCFEYGPVPPGEYLALVDPENFPILRRGPVTIEANSSHDFGALTCSIGRRLVVHVTRPASLANADLWPQVIGEDGSRFPHSLDGDTLTVDSIPPGKHTLRMSGRGVVSRSIGFVIEPGADTTLDVTIEPGFPRSVSIREFEGGERESVPFRVEDANGVLVFESHLWRTRSDAPHEGHFVLPEGEFVLIVEGGAGAPIRKPFTIRAGDPENVTFDS